MMHAKMHVKTHAKMNVKVHVEMYVLPFRSVPFRDKSFIYIHNSALYSHEEFVQTNFDSRRSLAVNCRRQTGLLKRARLVGH